MGFVNGFLSYLILMLIFVAVGAAAIALGIFLRKKADAKAENTVAEGDEA